MNVERSLKIILAPHISEKSTKGMEKNNEYVFEVISDARKFEIKQAVESLFNTKVTGVRVVNVRAKTKMFRGAEGKRKAWKKAYVTLAEGQTLETLGGGFNN